MVNEDIFYEGTEVVHYDAIVSSDPVDNRPAEDYTGKATYCIKVLGDDFYAKGTSICGKGDEFNPETGKKFAKDRADAATKYFRKFKLTQGTLAHVIDAYAERTDNDKKSRILAGDDLSELEVKLLAEFKSKPKAQEDLPPYEEHCGEHG